MAATTVGAATEQLDLANNTARTSLTFSMKMQLQHMASLATQALAPCELSQQWCSEQ